MIGGPIARSKKQELPPLLSSCEEPDDDYSPVEPGYDERENYEPEPDPDLCPRCGEDVTMHFGSMREICPLPDAEND